MERSGRVVEEASEGVRQGMANVRVHVHVCVFECMGVEERGGRLGERLGVSELGREKASRPIPHSAPTSVSPSLRLSHPPLACVTFSLPAPTPVAPCHARPSHF